MKQQHASTRWIDYSGQAWYTEHGHTVNQRRLTRADLDTLKRLAGTNEVISAWDIRHIYYPLAQLILKVFHHKQMQNPTQDLFVLGISGSVAVGKSTGARVLTELLRHIAPPIALVTTDNFLKPNDQLEKEGLLQRKGFPESYDEAVITRFIEDLAEKKPILTIPTYDHIAYTILPNRLQEIARPNIVVLEGVNVLHHPAFTLDFSLFFDAKIDDIANWYVQRFVTFQKKAFSQPGAYFQRYAKLKVTEAEQVAKHLWQTINLVNFDEHILPSSKNADCIILKHQNHRIQSIRVRTT